MEHCEHRPADHCHCEHPVVCLQSVTFRRGHATIIDNVSFCVHEGVFLGIIGPNGGGKTTLLQLVLGALQPQEGTVEVLGRPVGNLGRDRTLIGYLPQRAPIDAGFPATTMDVVLMGAVGKAGILRPLSLATRKHAAWLLDRVGLGDLADRPIGRMSGGQQQRALIARALVCQPRLLILDEPTSGLDSNGQQQFLHFVRDLQRELAITVMMVSHDVGQLSFYADQMACLNRKLHWHDHSTLLSDEIIRNVYACELESYRERIREISPA